MLKYECADAICFLIRPEKVYVKDSMRVDIF